MNRTRLHLYKNGHCVQRPVVIGARRRVPYAENPPCILNVSTHQIIAQWTCYFVLASLIRVQLFANCNETTVVILSSMWCRFCVK